MGELCVTVRRFESELSCIFYQRTREECQPKIHEQNLAHLRVFLFFLIPDLNIPAAEKWERPQKHHLALAERQRTGSQLDTSKVVVATHLCRLLDQQELDYSLRDDQYLASCSRLSFRTP